MAGNKSEEFEQIDQDMAMLAKALAHPARVAILKILATRGSCVCGEVVEVLPLAQATVSQHLKELKEAGLVQGAVDGPRICYCLNPIALEKAREAFAGLFGSLFQGQEPACDSSCC